MAEQARKAADIYQRNPKVEAIWIGGSVSRGWDDEYSDIELFLAWRNGPETEDRLEPVKALQGEIISFHCYEDEEWSEAFVTSEIKFELSHFLTSTVKKNINRTVGLYSPDLESQCLTSAVAEGVCLYGAEIFESLKQQTAIYPEGLKRAMILQSLDLGSRWNNRYSLVARQDWLMLHEVFVTVEKKMMAVLFALNEQFVHHPGFKWQRQSIQRMEIKPSGTETRLESVFLEHPAKGLMILEELLQDVFGLVSRHHPDIELDKWKAAGSSARPVRKTGE
nr:DUF4037 domain-containing protein [Metabacillus mangrovi]